MVRNGILGIIGFFLLFIINCGGGRKIASEARPLGFIPFPSENLSPDPAYLNEQLIKALTTSGSFRVILLQNTPSLADLNTLQHVSDSSITFILTGRFLQESEETSAGKHVPLLLYLPKQEVKVRAEILLYNKEKKGWQTIQEVEGTATKKGGIQVGGMDKEHPDLQIAAPEYVRLQQTAYHHLFYNIVNILEKEMEIKK